MKNLQAIFVFVQHHPTRTTPHTEQLENSKPTHRVTAHGTARHALHPARCTHSQRATQPKAKTATAPREPRPRTLSPTHPPPPPPGAPLASSRPRLVSSRLLSASASPTQPPPPPPPRHHSSFTLAERQTLDLVPATAMSKAWGGLGGAGAWALDAERAEEEERESAAAPAPAAGFPSLREAAAGAAAGKSKKKKGTTLSLSEFTTYGAAAGRRPAAAAAEPKGLTPQEMMMLPTGPRERSTEELDRSRLGGGFRSYGSGERRGGFDDDGRRGGPGRDADLDMPSRADESGNWSLNKKSFTPSPADSGARSRYGSLGGGGGGAPAASSFGRADDDSDWSRGKKPMPMPSRYPSLGSGGGGGGFRDSPTSTDSDRWSRAAPLPPHNGERERPRLVLDPPKRDASATPTPPPAEAARSRPSPFGAARPREDILAEKGLDWRKMETEIDHKTSRPTSSQSSRPGSAHSSLPGSPGSQTSAVGSEGVPRARPKVNPFGDAKPREVVLQEKGKDWRKIDLELEHRRIDRYAINGFASL